MTNQELHNPEFERAVIGGILVLGTEGLEAAFKAGLDYPHFYDGRLRSVYRAALSLASSGREIDYLTIIRELSENDKLAKIEAAFLTGLSDGIPRAINIQHYADLVIKDSHRRQLLVSLDNASKAAISGNGEFEDACRDLAQALSDHQHRGKAAHEFAQIREDRFSLALPEISITLEVDRLRREHGELIGELSVRCALPGIPTYDGSLSIADFNLSSARARTERASLLSKRANSKKLDWPAYLEEFCQRVLSTERNGQPAVDLREIPKPGPDNSLSVEGLRLPRLHPTIIFGDGGAAKSYTGLYLAGCLVEQGLTVALFDWELAAEDHRDRLERLFGKAMPKIYYARCEKPLIHEADRLIRIIRNDKIDYAIYDSIAFACDGAPESAEIAGRYFRAVRQVGVGSLHIAHITKSEGGDQKPFGSVFWHNGARSTYYVKLADTSPDGKTLSVGLYNRKSNLGGLLQPIAYTINFTQDRTFFSKSDPVDSPDLAAGMTVRQRLYSALQGGARTFEEVSEQIDTPVNTLRTTVRRHSQTFVVLNDGKVALLQRFTGNCRDRGQVSSGQLSLTSESVANA